MVLRFARRKAHRRFQRGDCGSSASAHEFDCPKIKICFRIVGVEPEGHVQLLKSLLSLTALRMHLGKSTVCLGNLWMRCCQCFQMGLPHLLRQTV